jgi:hypothetical protein
VLASICSEMLFILNGSVIFDLYFVVFPFFFLCTNGLFIQVAKYGLAVVLQIALVVFS